MWTYIKMKRNNRCKKFIVWVCFLLTAVFSYQVKSQTPTSLQKFLPIKQNQLWGAIDYEGNVIIPPHYTYLASVDGTNLAIARKDKHLGLINFEGNTILPFKYRNIRPLGDSLLALLAETWQIFRIGENQFLPGVYDNVQLYENPDDPERETHLIRVWKNGKQGFLDFSGSYLISPRYDYIEPIRPNLYKVFQNGAMGLLHAQKGLILAAEYQAITWQKDYFSLEKDSLYGLANAQGQLIIPAQYDSVCALNPAPQDRVWLVRKEDKWGLIGPQGENLVSLAYQDIFPLKPGFCIVKKAGKVGLYTWQKEEALACAYDEIAPLQEGYARYRQGGRSGVFGYRQKKSILPPLYKEIEVFATPQWPRDHFLVREGEQMGVLDEDNSFRIPLGNYDYISFDPTGLFRLKSHGKWGIASESGSLSPQFDYISAFQKQIALVKNGSSYGLINRYGQVLASPQYQKIEIRARTAKLFLPFRGVDVIELNDQGRAVNRYSLTQLKTIKLVKAKSLEIINDEASLWDFTPPSNQPNLNQRPVSPNFSPSAPVSPLGWREAPGPDVTVGDYTWFNDTLSQKWGLKNAQDSVVIPALYEAIRIHPSLPLTSIRQDKRLSGMSFGSNRPRYYGLVNHQVGRYVIRPNYNTDIEQALGDFEQGKVARQDRYYVFIDGSRIPNLPQLQRGEVEVLKRIFFAEAFQANQISRCNVGGYPANLRTRRIELKQDIRGGRWGLVHRNGSILAHAIYDDISQFDSRGFAWVWKNRKVGILDTSGREVIPLEFEEISFLNPEEANSPFLLIQERPQWGFVDSSGQVRVDLSYLETRPFSEGKAAVRMANKRWTFITENNQVFDTLGYREVRDFSEGRVAVKENYHWGFLDEKGQKIGKHQYGRVGDFHEGKAWVRKNRKYGYIYQDGEGMIACQFGKLSDFEGGRAVALDVKKNAYGLIDTQGKWVARPKYLYIGPLRADGFRVFRAKSHSLMIGLLDQNGKEVLPNHFHRIALFDSWGLAWVKKNRGSSYFIDPSGNRAVSSSIEEAWPFKEGMAAVKIKGQWGYIDRQGSLKIAPQFTQAHSFFKGYAQVKKDRKTYYIDTAGKLHATLPAKSYWIKVNEIDSLRPFYEGRAAYQKNGKWGFLDKSGKVLLYPRYESVSDFYQGFARVSHKGRDRYVNTWLQFSHSLRNDVEWLDRGYPYIKLINRANHFGLENQEGFLLIPPRFAEVKPFKEGKAAVQVRFLKGLADQEGQILLPVIYEIIQAMGQGLYRIERNNDLGYWHEKNGWIWPMP